MSALELGPGSLFAEENEGSAVFASEFIQKALRTQLGAELKQLVWEGDTVSSL